MTQYDLQFALASVYAERASVATALARCARAQGCPVGFAVDPKEPAWPVLFIELPTGQVSWHFSEADRHLLASDIGEYHGQWDGHTTEEKYDRLARWRP